MSLATPWAERHPRILRIYAGICTLAALGLVAAVAAYGIWPPELVDLLAGFFVAFNAAGAAYCFRQARRLSRVALQVHPDRLELANLDGARTLSRSEIDRFEIACSGDFWAWQTREQAVYAITRAGERVELQALRHNGWRTFGRANAAALEPYLTRLTV